MKYKVGGEGVWEESVGKRHADSEIQAVANRIAVMSGLVLNVNAISYNVFSWRKK